MKKPEFISVAKAVIFSIPIVVFGVLLIRYTAFTGHIHLEYDFDRQSKTISQWTPAGRALDRVKNLETGESYQQIVGEPVYMDVKVPRSFDRVEATLEYKNGEQPLVELGVVTSTDPWNVRTSPVESKVIDQAIDEWEMMTQANGTVLLQRNADFDSVDAFIANPPRDKGIAIYRQPLVMPYTDATYTPTDKEITINRVLRGPHEFVTYIKNETLHIEFDLIDINREFNGDIVTLQLFNQTEQLHQEVLNDDGILDASGTTSAQKTLTLDLPDLPEGLYTIKLLATDDIIIPRVHTTQDRLVVKNRLFVINNEEYRSMLPTIATDPTTIYANLNKFAAKTDHLTGIQTLSIDSEPFEIEKTHDQWTWVAEDQTVAPSLRTITMPKNDVYLVGNGYYAFSEDDFFDPDFFMESIDETTSLERLDYILMRDYTSPVALSNRRLKQTTVFSLDGVAGDRKHLQFLLSVPGIDRNRYTIQIHSISFDFYRDPLWVRLKQRISALIN